MGKNNLNDLLDNKPQRIKKPKGLTLSTDLEQSQDTSTQEHKDTNALKHESTNAQVQKDTTVFVQENTSAQVQKSTNAQVKDPRPSKGYKIRTDIADACKLLAVQQKRKMYEVMEEGLLLYLRQNGVDIS